MVKELIKKKTIKKTAKERAVKIIKEAAPKKPKKRVLRKAKALGVEKEVKIEKKPEPKKPVFEKKPFVKKFISKIGRRKEASARIKLTSGVGSIMVNGIDYKKYFPYFEFQQIIESPLTAVGQKGKCDVQARVLGGGKRGQAEAIRLAIARCLKQRNIMFRVPLKKAGFLTRDAREKERKKYGLKRARRAPQWQKR